MIFDGVLSNISSKEFASLRCSVVEEQPQIEWKENRIFWRDPQESYLEIELADWINAFSGETTFHFSADKIFIAQTLKLLF